MNKQLYETYNNIDYKQSRDQKIELNKQTHCFVCNESFGKKKKGDRRLHHDYRQGENNIIGYACVRCNLSMTKKRKAGIPVILHNGSHYDWKFIMKEIGSVIEEENKLETVDPKNKLELENIEVLGLTSENYITRKWNNMVH